MLLIHSVYGKSLFYNCVVYTIIPNFSKTWMRVVKNNPFHKVRPYDTHCPADVICDRDSFSSSVVWYHIFCTDPVQFGLLLCPCVWFTIVMRTGWGSDLVLWMVTSVGLHWKLGFYCSHSVVWKHGSQHSSQMCMCKTVQWKCDEELSKYEISGKIWLFLILF